MLVEESPVVRSGLRDLLQRHRYRVIEVTDGQQALNTLGHVSTEIDLCLIDLNLPQVDGLTVISTARRAGFFKPMVPLTAYCSSEMRRQARRLGASGWLTKPVEPQTLIYTIKQLTV